MDKELMTLLEICQTIGAKETSVRKALDALGLRPSRLDFSDRRRLVYPKGAAEQVKQWLIDHSSES